MTILLLALKSLLVAAATLLLLRLTRNRSAAERSTIAHLGLFALVALPLAGLALPALSLTLPASVAQFATPEARSPAVPPATTALARKTVAASHVPAMPAAASAGEASDQPSAFSEWAMTAARHAYLLPTAALLLLTLAALLRLFGLRARAEVLVDPEWLQALARAQRRMGFKSGTALLKSDELASPISWGLMRPTILLSDEATRSPDQAEAIIAHELAHVVQLDWAKLMLARVATAAFWFNPLAWVLAREAHQLREEAADDAVLAANVSGPDYAQLLIGVARHECRGVLLGAHGVAPGKNSLRRRVARVLDRTPARGPSGKSWVAGFATGMLCMAAPLAAVTFAPSRAAVTPVSPAQGVKAWNTPVAAVPAPAAPMPAAVALGAAHPVAVANGQVAVAPAAPIRAVEEDEDKQSGGSIDIGDNVASAVQASNWARNFRPQISVKVAPMPRPFVSVAPPPAPPAGQVNVDQIIQMHNMGVTPEFKRAMAEAGYPGLSPEQLIQARAVGVSPQYVREMRAAGVTGDFEEIVGARATGLDPAYIGAMRKLGVRADLGEYQGMIATGVTPDYVRRLRAHGLAVTSPDKLIQLRSVGFDPDKKGDDD